MSRETKFSGAYWHREIFIFPFQLTPSRIVNNHNTRLIHNLAICVMMIKQFTYILYRGKTVYRRYCIQSKWGKNVLKKGEKKWWFSKVFGEFKFKRDII